MNRKNKAPKASKSSKSSQAPNAEVKYWGDWGWSEEYDCRCRYAYNEHGQHVDTEYETQYYPPENVPREPGHSVEQLTTSLGGTSIEDPNIPEEQGEPHYTLGQSVAPGSEDTDAYDRKGKSKAISPEAQGLSGQTPDEPYTAEQTTESTQDHHNDEPFYAIDSRGTLTDGEEQVEGASAEPDEGYPGTQGVYPPVVDGTTDYYPSTADYENQVAAAMLVSKNDAFGQSKPGQSSTGQNLDDGHGDTPQSPGYAAAAGYSAYGEIETQDYEESTVAYAEEGGGYPDDAYEEENANTVPEMPRVITGTSGDHESTDPRFTLMNSQYWQPGTVFKILWAEPQGQSKSRHGGTFFTEKHTVDNGAGKSFHVKLRRFIIYGTGEGQSTCVPIFTYNNQGCKKSGVKPENHGIVHDYNATPRMLHGEPQLGFAPAAIVLTEPTEKITKDSRVNYSQLMTVQHNVKIFIIGYTDQESFQIVQEAVNHCFSKLSTNFSGAPKPKSSNPKKEKGVRRHHRR